MAWCAVFVVKQRRRHFEYIKQWKHCIIDPLAIVPTCVIIITSKSNVKMFFSFDCLMQSGSHFFLTEAHWLKLSVY